VKKFPTCEFPNSPKVDPRILILTVVFKATASASIITSTPANSILLANNQSSRQSELIRFSRKKKRPNHVVSAVSAERGLRPQGSKYYGEDPRTFEPGGIERRSRAPRRSKTEFVFAEFVFAELCSGAPRRSKTK